MMKGHIIVALVLITAVAFAVMLKEQSKSYWSHEDHSKYLKFSHTLHVKEREITCEDCHLNAKESKLSSDNLIGDHQSCQTCHEDQISNDCLYCHTTQEDIIPLKSPKREILFSHELHATTYKLPCEQCHAGVENVTYVTNENMPSMTSCMDCHTEKKTSNQCETCHRDFVSLVPEDHRTGDFWKQHKEHTRLGMLDVSCGTCHTETFCQDCHTGVELQGLGLKKDLITEPSSRSSTKDSPKQLRLQQVHSLNYRFTHGIDAKSKLIDCASCHDQQTFCVTCHEAGGNITQLKFKPQSHNVAGFTTLGTGTGGGLHAELARRDLETCVSCHDVQGQDPICMMCHTESGFVR
ncbi:MAG: hypothetical protein HY707_14465 [Ignavibacteriae bacterium]|nr:hypothetical protein [Ignavibacteriota bacterium]